MGGMFTDVCIFVPLFVAYVNAFSSTPTSSSFDRFRASCPSDLDAIRRFDPTLVVNDVEDVWVAVFRTANNLPSVFVRDEFFDAMASATTLPFSSNSNNSSSITGGSSSGVMIVANRNENQTPVAIARLRKGDDGNGNDSSSTSYYIMDAMLCSLRKEDTNPDCDGGSEHSEALGVCIDELVLAYLRGRNNECNSFDGGIRFRGTLISGRLLSSRGFREVSDLQLPKDVRTSHESDVDGAMERYSERMTTGLFPGARERASSIVSYLGRMDREEDKRRRRSDFNNNGEDVVAEDGEGGEGDFDPWASIKRYI